MKKCVLREEIERMGRMRITYNLIIIWATTEAKRDFFFFLINCFQTYKVMTDDSLSIKYQSYSQSPSFLSEKLSKLVLT